MTADDFSNQGLLSVLRHASDGVALLIPSPWRVAWSNAAFANWLKIEPEELSGAAISNLQSRISITELLPHLDQLRTAVEGSQTYAEATCVTVNERCRLKLLRLASQTDAAYALIVQHPAVGDEATAALQTRLDPLTNLPDRSFLLARMETLLQGDRIGDRAFAVLFIDLDNFKQANDRFGHIAGDRILRSAADRLRHCVRENDHVVRFGGDEFVVLLEGVAERADVEPVIERIGQAFLEPFDLATERIKLSLSIGVAVASLLHRSPEDVLSEADSDMYAAKRASG
jgi:diguanylate cyclase (GGDEF)-like protein